MKKIIIVIFLCIIAANASAQYRSINSIFPNLSQNILSQLYSSEGYVNTGQLSDGINIIARNPGCALDSQIVTMALQNNPRVIVESIKIISVPAGSISLLNIYNALAKVRDLKGRLYDSATKGRPVPLFEDASRIVSERDLSNIPDPPASSFIPASETVYIRLRDTNFGNTYYRGQVSLFSRGIRYTLTNFRNMTYLLVPVIRQEQFTAQLYFEQIQEGILLYSIAGADMSNFVSSMIDVPSAIAKRLAVITSWAEDGIRSYSR